MKERIRQMALAALSTDSFPRPIPERCADPAELDDPVAVAQGMRRFLLRQPVEIRPGELLADRYRYGGCDYPADFYKRAGHRHLSRVWQQCCFSSHPNDLYYWGWTHVSLDYGYILQNGLRGYLDRIDAAAARYSDDEKKIRFLEGMRIAITAIQERSALIAKAAGQAAETENDLLFRRNELSVADRMERVPMEPAKDFREAVTCVWTMFLTAPDRLGRIVSIFIRIMPGGRRKALFPAKTRRSIFRSCLSASMNRRLTTNRSLTAVTIIWSSADTCRTGKTDGTNCPI